MFAPHARRLSPEFDVIRVQTLNVQRAETGGRMPLDDSVSSEAGALHRTLQSLGAVTEDDFSRPGITFQIGVEPVRIAIITAVDGLTFAAAWRNRVASEYDGEPVFVLSREDLIQNKRASGRPQDLADIAALEHRK